MYAKVDESIYVVHDLFALIFTNGWTDSHNDYSAHQKSYQYMMLLNSHTSRLMNFENAVLTNFL